MTLFWLLVLVGLFLAAEFSFLGLKIVNDRYYSTFHFLGGFFIFLFLQSFIDNNLLSFVFTFFVGVWWEIYEWVLWKLLKKRKYEPKSLDTKMDLIFDMLGAATAFIILNYFG